MDEVLGHLTNDGGRLALLYLDLDKFKYVNDTLGHPAGDTLLESVARRLRACVRDSDIVARLGGDEFAILYLSPELPAAAMALAQRVIDTIGAPYQLGQRPVHVGVSIGIAIASGSETDGDTLLKNADMALYQAKAKGGRSYCIFEADMEANLRMRGLQVKLICASRWNGNNSRSITSLSMICKAISSADSKLYCVGTIQPAGWCCQGSSSHWPRSWAS
jgi:diguanylate cyclase (GGDEF)-like protein